MGTPDERESLEIEKLKLEVKELGRPVWLSSTFWFGLIGGIVALGGMWLQLSAAKAEAASAQEEKAVAVRNERQAVADLDEADAALSVAKVTLDKSTRDNELLVRQLDGLVKDGKAIHPTQMAEILKSVESSSKPILDLKSRIDRLPVRRAAPIRPPAK